MGLSALRGQLGNSSTLPVYAGKSLNFKILSMLSEPVLGAWGKKPQTTMQGKGKMWYKVCELRVHGQTEVNAGCW